MRLWALWPLATLASCALFPSLEELTGPDASVDANADAPADTNADAFAGDGGFNLMIGCSGPVTDLLAYYTFNETTGSAVPDCTKNANDGTISIPAHGSWGAGHDGNALTLTASGTGCVDVDFATPTFNFGASPFTVTWWLDMKTLPTSTELGYIVGRSSDPSKAGWRVAVDSSGAVAVSVPNGSGGIAIASGPSAISLSTWTHIAVVFNASLAVYINGVSGTVHAGPTTFTADVAPDDLRVGCSSDDQHQLLGSVDELRFYGRALSSAEIQTIVSK